MKRICVFCGSSIGAKETYRENAVIMGETLAQRGIGLVYGGGQVGLMGVVADAAKKAGGEVIGVIPKFLDDLEIGHTGLDDLRIVDNMHERKALMAELSDGFIAMPGGIGTLEELFEVWTWSQLGEHAKPCGLLNIDGYYSKLEEFLDHIVEERFLLTEHRDLLHVSDVATELLDAFATHKPLTLRKWIEARDL